MSPRFGDYQIEIYLGGLSGVLPSMPMAHEELEARARAALAPSLLSYIAGGAGDEFTQRANVTAFQQWGLVPRMLVGAAERDLSVDLFGRRLPTPLFMAPVGVIGLCTQDGHGDLATARAAARTGVPMVASTLTVDPMEQVAAEFGAASNFPQLRGHCLVNYTSDPVFRARLAKPPEEAPGPPCWSGSGSSGTR